MAKYRLFAIRFLNRQLHPMFTPPRAVFQNIEFRNYKATSTAKVPIGMWIPVRAMSKPHDIAA